MSSSSPTSSPLDEPRKEKRRKSPTTLSTTTANNVDGSEVIEGAKIEALEQQLRVVEAVIAYIAENDLGASESLFYIMNNSVNVQRIATLTQLHNYLDPDPVARIAAMRVLCTQLLKHDPEVLVAAAKGFETVLLSDDISQEKRSELFSDIYDLTFQIPPGLARVAWLETTFAVVRVMSPQSVAKLVAPCAIALCESIDSALREVGPQLLAITVTIAPAVGVDAKVIEVVEDLSHDSLPEVRLELAKRFLELSTPILSLIVKEHLLIPLVRLLLDDEMRVSSEAFVCLIEWSSRLEDRFVLAFIYPVLRQYVVGCPQPVQETVAKQFGKLIWNTRKCFEALGDGDLFTAIYLALASSSDEAFRVHCAFNFPGVVASLPRTFFISHLNATLKALCADVSPRVRYTIACGFHELCSLVGQLAGPLLIPHFIKLLGDVDINVRERLVGNLTTIFNAFSASLDLTKRGEFFATCAPLLESYERDVSTNWRKVNALLSHAQLFPFWFTARQLHTHFVPLLVKHLSIGASALKKTACTTLAIFLRTMSSDEDKAMSVKSIRKLIVELGSCKSAAGRIAFVDLCEEMLRRFSMRFFKAFLFTPLMNLKGDPINNVRFRFTRFLSVLHAYYSESPGDQPISDSIAAMKNDKDVDVAAIAASQSLSSLDPKQGSSKNDSLMISTAVMDRSLEADLQREEGSITSQKIIQMVIKMEQEDADAIKLARRNARLVRSTNNNANGDRPPAGSAAAAVTAHQQQQQQQHAATPIAASTNSSHQKDHTQQQQGASRKGSAVGVTPAGSSSASSSSQKINASKKG